ncbi:MAG: heparinase II/III family protein [Candidatus Solibacter usitatus]|nr:heparinase II/III family protein [Candidatus Solibacter usitatus]
MRAALLLLISLRTQAEPGRLWTPAGIERVKATAAAEPWAAEIVGDLIRRAGDWPQAHLRAYGLKEWALPAEGAGWSHAYVCPDHGVRLQQRQGRNLCPVDGRDYHGWPIDNVVYMQRNGDNARAARDLGLAWRLTGKEEYAAKARRILNAYTRLYPALPIHDNNNNKPDTPSGARVMSQTLSEAGWLVPLVFAYDLAGGSMSAEERSGFETNVLRNAAAVIAPNNRGKSNWQSWHNAALLGAGLAVGDTGLVSLALDGPGGFKFQMRESITADGPWYEGAWGYHFFSVEPLTLTYEMAKRAGIALPEAAALRRMLEAPERCVFPDGTLPNFNDSGLVKLPERRKPLDRLLWGDSPFAAEKAAATRATTSDLMPGAGMATLRVRGSDHTLAVKFGAHGGGHGHYDKLSFISYSNGAHQAADPGTQAYAVRSHATWDKMTVAHNTLVVDEKNQAEATGRLLQWTPGADATIIRLSAGAAYKGVEIERTLVHTARYTLDIVDARSTDGAPHRFDWLYHNHGKLAQPPAGPPAAVTLPGTTGYQHLANPRAVLTAGAWDALFMQKTSGLRLHMLGGSGTTVVSGEGLGPDLTVPVPFVMARREGLSARFVAVYEPFISKPAGVTLTETDEGAFAVAGEGFRHQVRIADGKATISGM